MRIWPVVQDRPLFLPFNFYYSDQPEFYTEFFVNV